MRFAKRAPGFLTSVAATLALALSASADEIELKNGTKYQGRVVEQTAQSVRFKIFLPGGGKIVSVFSRDRVRSLKVDGKDPVLKPPKHDPKPSPKPKPDPKPRTRSVAEVLALIERAGKTPPDWWDAVPLKYPKTLDLTGAKQTKGPQNNLGSYKWSVLNRDPRKWKEAVKLFRHVVDVRKNDASRLPQAMDLLAAAWRDYVGDPARAAYWWRASIKARKRPYSSSIVGLAECYWKLGCKAGAIALLKRYGLDSRSSHRSAIKLWGEMGETGTALAMAERRARSGRPDDGYLLAGNACRFAGLYDKAAEYYKKVLTATQGSGRGKQNRDRASAGAEAMKLVQTLDRSRIPDGTYKGSSRGYKSTLEVEVAVKDKTLVSVKVTRENDTRFFSDIAKRDVPPRIVGRQGITGVDTVTGATITSEAIINATVKALSSGMK